MFPGLFQGPKKKKKKEGNYRMILSLETFNGFLKFKRCKLESVEDALDLVTKGCYFGSIERCFLYHPYS